MTTDKPLAVGFVEDRWEAGVAGLSHEAEYVYFRLCKAMWAAGKGVHPDDVTAVCRFYKGTKKGLAELERKGKLRLLDGLWVNDRALAEHAGAVERQAKNRARGRAGAGARWGQSDSQADAQAHAQASPEHSPSNSHPYPYPLEKIPTTQRVSSDGATRARTKADHGIAWPVPEAPPDWAGYEAELRGLPAAAVAETYTRWRDHRMARGMTPVDPVADWRAWCSSEVKRLRDGTGPPGTAAQAKPATHAEVMALVRKKLADVPADPQP